jgi:hypothetical protein
LDIEYIDQAVFQRLMGKAEETSRVIGGLRIAVAKRR